MSKEPGFWNRRYWAARAGYFLVRDMNCGQASLRTVQDRIGKKRDRLLTAATGLEGGIVASGSTCGVVTGGSLGLALALSDAVSERGPAGEVAALSLVSEYASWFAAEYGNTACRKRVGVSFRTARGQVRYFLGPDKIALCVSHIGGAVNRLDELCRRDLPPPPPEAAAAKDSRIHCARAVLSEVRKRTGVSDPLLSQLSYVYDGGVGLSGGACGALVGAILAINLLLGMDIRNVPYLMTFKPFLVGHKNVLTEAPPNPPEPFGVGRIVMNRFRESAGYTECRPIVGRNFSSWADFAAHRLSGKCDAMVAAASDAACDAIGAI